MSKLPVAVLLCCGIFFSVKGFSQQPFFKDVNESAISRQSAKKTIQVPQARTLELDITGLQLFLASLPTEKNSRARGASSLLIPMPDGSSKAFLVWESSIMEPGLANRYTSIKTYAGEAMDKGGDRIRFDMTPLGFHAIIHSSGDAAPVYIDPYQSGDITHYTSFRRADITASRTMRCETEGSKSSRDGNTALREQAGVCVGTQLRTFRLAVAGTGEYSTAVCAAASVALTKANILAAMVTTINRVNMVYESDLAIRLVLVANNDQLIYLDAATDPYTNLTNTATLNTNNTNCNNVIGSSNYDIGHIFNTDDGGIAGLGVVCTTSKGRGATGLPNPIGEIFNIDYVAHEIGHQFGANHTFNAETGNCGGGNRNASTAVEPGSGVTIMGYAGICSAVNNLAASSIPYFHGVSIDEIGTYVNTISCQVTSPITNAIPVVNAGASYTIPASTPFILTGSATDGDGDALTYSWEQIDIGPAGNWNAPSGNAPLFRPFAPTSTPERYFPRISNVIANTTTIGELLPTGARTMNFRLTARDGKGVCAAETQVTVANTGAPFQVTAPNTTGISWPGGSAQTITWNVAGTDNAPISCANVTIELSTNGGLTFTTVLAASTPNDGSEQIILPSIASTTARIRVRALGNIFYDISNNNFEIATPQPGFNLLFTGSNTIPCPVAPNAVTPVTIGTLQVTSVLGFTAPVTLSALQSPAGTTITFGSTTVVPGNSTTIQITGANLLDSGVHTIRIQGVSGSITNQNDFSFTIQPGTGPGINTQPQNVQVCAQQNASFAVSAVAGSTSSYQWQVSTNGGGSYSNLSGQTGATLNLTNVALGQNNNLYRVLLSGQCNVTSSNAATLTVFTLPQVSLTASPGTSIQPGSPTTLTATVIPGSSSTITSSWLYNGNSIAVSGTTLPVTVEGLGIYQVNVVDANTCTAASQTLTITAQSSDRLFVYPNPSDGQFIVTYFNTSGNTTRTVTVHDAKGARVYSRSYPVGSSYQLHTVNIRGIASGVYYVTLSDADGKKIKTERLLIR